MRSGTKFLIVIALVVLAIFGGVAPYYSAREFADSRGRIKTFNSCVFDRGPFWYHGKTPVYYVTFEDGRKAYIAVTIFGTEIKYVTE